MAVTGAIFRGLIFDGINSKDYGIYITGTGVYNAPERDVTMVSIPGRNGDLAIDNGRFNNIEVTYHCGTFGDSQEDFAEGISRFRNALCSRQGYVRITDDYNSGEYRLGIYKHGLDVDAETVKGGEFDIVFDCKPQRWLTSGEEPINVDELLNPQTASGSIVTFDADECTVISSLKVSITPKQAGSGDPSPSNVRPITGTSTANVFVTGFNQWDEEWENGEYLTTDGAKVNSDAVRCKNLIPIVGGNSYYFHCGKMTSGNKFGYCLYDASQNYIRGEATGNNLITTPSRARFISFFAPSSWYGTTYNNDISINYPSTDTEYQPYTSHTTPVPLGQTVYGGEVDVATGVLKTFPYYSSYNGETLAGRWVCDRAVYSEGTTPPTGSQVVDMSGTVDITVQLTPAQVATLLGTNNVWSEGDVEVTWAESQKTLTNPTLFDAKPILSFEGIGNIGIGNKTIKVKDVLFGWITIANGAPGESTDLRVVDTSYTLDMSNVNTGDTIMAGDYSNGNIGNFLAITRVKNMPAFDSVRTTKSGDYYIDANATKVSSSEIQTGVSFSNVVFTAGTSADLSATSKIEFYSGSTRVGVVQWDTQVHYDGGNTIRVIAQIATDATLYKKYELSVPKTRANSTKSTLTGTTYIDLDVEEAWMKSNGQTIVSANDHVVLGAEPPVLPPGATRITYNGTITNLKITPRWWRV